MNRVLLGEMKADDAAALPDVKVDGTKGAFGELIGMLDKDDFWFDIVTP